MLLPELLELLKTKPREEANAEIDRWIVARPDLRGALEQVRAVINASYEHAALYDVPVKAAKEAWDLIQKGWGPVSDAPEIAL